MATLLPNGKQAFTGAGGLPLVGGKLYTYAAGTNTPKSTYSDAAGSVPNTNPVVLDARGEATVFWSGVYKAVLQDALGDIIWTVDNINASGTSATLADLKTSDPSSRSFILADGINPPVVYAYIAGNFTGADDEVNVVKLNSVPINVGALVRQDSSGVTFQNTEITGAPAILSVEAKNTQTHDLRDYLGYQPGLPNVPTGNDMAPIVQRSIETFRAHGVLPHFPAGGINIGQSVQLCDGFQIKSGATKLLSIHAPPGMVDPLLTMDSGPVQHVIIDGVSFIGNGEDGSCLARFIANFPAAPAGQQGGMWAPVIQNVYAQDFDFSFDFITGSDTGSLPNQFPVLNYNEVNRTSKSHSRCVRALGQFGQPIIVGGRYNSRFEGIDWAPGANIVFSRRYADPSGMLVDAVEALDAATLIKRPGYAGGESAGTGSANLYGVNIHGAALALCVDGSQVNMFGGYVEKAIRAFVAVDSTLSAQGVVLQNAAGSPDSGGNGAICEGRNSTVTFGGENVVGYLDRTTCSPDRTVSYWRSSPGAYPNKNPAAYTSQVTHQVALNVNELVSGNFASLLINGDDNVPPRLRYVTSGLPVGERMSLQVLGGAFVIEPGYAVFGLTQPIYLAAGDTFDLVLRDLGNSWTLESVRSSDLVAASVPTTGRFFKGQIVRNSNVASGQPQGWVCSADGNPATFVAQPSYP